MPSAEDLRVLTSRRERRCSKGLFVGVYAARLDTDNVVVRGKLLVQ